MWFGVAWGGLGCCGVVWGVLGWFGVFPRTLDSRPSGRVFEPHPCHCAVVLEQDTFILA